jgi:hypothetical protein
MELQSLVTVILRRIQRDHPDLPERFFVFVELSEHHLPAAAGATNNFHTHKISSMCKKYDYEDHVMECLAAGLKVKISDLYWSRYQ